MFALMWFRNDLRLADNTALIEAARGSDGVVAVFCLCSRQWRSHDWGPAKVEFIRRNLIVLAAELAERNIPFRLISADTFEIVPKKLLASARKLRCSRLFFNREHEINERRRDASVERLFRENNMEVRSYDDQTILPPDEIRTGQGGYYTVFTPFKNKWIQAFQDRSDVLLLPPPKKQKPLDISSDEIPEQIKGIDLHTPSTPSDGPTLSYLWPPGERAALKRLREFIARRLHDYRDQRDFPADPGTSELSPYLAAGVLSPRQCLAAALDANRGRLDSGDRGAVAWIGELVWREFYRHVLVGFPRVCMNRPFKPETDRLPWSGNERHFEAWQAGRTGVPIVDAGMRQLRATGWMHNRVRMIAAMYLTKDLFIDWRWGERHFMRNLIDADFASNNGGWQWSASTGTDAAPYFRVFNPISQSRKFDPDGEYIRRYVPELRSLDARTIHDPSPSIRPKLDYPPSLVDHAAARRRVLDAFKILGGRRLESPC